MLFFAGHFDKLGDDLMHAAAGTKTLAIAGENNNLNRGIVRHHCKHPFQLGVGFESQRVEPIGIVQANRRDAVGHLEDETQISHDAAFYRPGVRKSWQVCVTAITPILQHSISPVFF